jgi:Aspartyl protease
MEMLGVVEGQMSAVVSGSELVSILQGVALMYLPVKLDSRQAASALIDSGATHNFMSEERARQAGFKLVRSAAPMAVRLADGQEVLSYSEALGCMEVAAGVRQRLRFWLMPLAMDVVLGMPWL